jgi:hypothetical protein
MLVEFYYLARKIALCSNALLNSNNIESTTLVFYIRTLDAHLNILQHAVEQRN